MSGAAYRPDIVIPAKAGVQGLPPGSNRGQLLSRPALDARFRGHDEKAGVAYAKLGGWVPGPVLKHGPAQKSANLALVQFPQTQG